MLQITISFIWEKNSAYKIQFIKRKQTNINELFKVVNEIIDTSIIHNSKLLNANLFTIDIQLGEALPITTITANLPLHPSATNST